MSIDNLDTLFSNMEPENETLKILKILLDPDTNLEVKSEIKKPFLFSALKTYEDYLEQYGLKDSAGILSTFMKNSFRLLISKDRKSREEIIRAVASSSTMNNTEMSLGFKDKKKGLTQR